MNAERMFNLINYELNKERDSEIEYAHRVYPEFIHFDKARRRVCKYCKKLVLSIYEYTVFPETITLSELEAINEQVKELGWND